MHIKYQSLRKNIGPKKNHGSMMKGDNPKSSEKTRVYKSQVHRQDKLYSTQKYFIFLLNIKYLIFY